jgi:hypothetical protein
MLQWFVQYGTAVQAITAIISLILTVGAIAVTWWYVALTKDIAETTHRQLSAVLQPMILIEVKSTVYGSFQAVDIDETTYDVSGRFGITNIGKSPVKLKALYAVIQLRDDYQYDGLSNDHIRKVKGYDGHVLMPEQSLSSPFSVDVPSPAWQPPDIFFGLRVICTDLSELIEHEFTFHPSTGVRHSSKFLSKSGPFERLKRIAVKIEAKVDALPELKNPSRTSHEDE